jgi:hypothetical protein
MEEIFEVIGNTVLLNTREGRLVCYVGYYFNSHSYPIINQKNEQISWLIHPVLKKRKIQRMLLVERFYNYNFKQSQENREHFITIE